MELETGLYNDDIYIYVMYIYTHTIHDHYWSLSWLLLHIVAIINSYYCNCSWLLSRLAINAKSWHQVQTAHISYMWSQKIAGGSVKLPSLWKKMWIITTFMENKQRSIKPTGLILVIFGCLIFWICGAAPNIRGQRLKQIKHLILWMDIVSSQSELWKIPFGHQSWQAGKCTNEVN